MNTVQSGYIGEFFFDNRKNKNVQLSNLIMTKAVSDAIRTSLGPHGMDKAIISNDEILITNDGATILKNASFSHPAAKVLVEISKSQDSEVGDGTTSVIVLSGSFLGTSLNLLKKGIDFRKIVKTFELCLKKSNRHLLEIAIPVDLEDKSSLYHTAYTTLESKVILSHSHIFAPLAVEAVLSVTDVKRSIDLNLNNIKIIKKLGGTIEQSQLINGIGINYPTVKSHGGPTKIINAKIGIIQFCINSPSTDSDNIVIVKNYSSMDKILREENQFIIAQCRKIRASGCNVLIAQKSIMRESLSNFALETLSKMKIMVIRDVERSEISFISETLGCTPVVDIEMFSRDVLGIADLVEEKSYCEEKAVLFNGIRFSKNKAKTIILRGSNHLLLDEAERSFHDALCSIRSIIRRRFIIGGGGAAEMEVSSFLKNLSKTITGSESYVMLAFANSLEIIPYTLSENAGLQPIDVISKLRKLHVNGNRLSGINSRKGIISNMLKENIISPLLVFTSILNISVEFSAQLLKIDDILES